MSQIWAVFATFVVRNLRVILGCRFSRTGFPEDSYATAARQAKPYYLSSSILHHCSSHLLVASLVLRALHAKLTHGMAIGCATGKPAWGSVAVQSSRQEARHS